MILLFTWILINHKIKPNAIIQKNIQNKFWSKKVDKIKYDLIIAGDSRVYRGISAQILENQLGLSSYNLGLSSAIYDSEYLDLISHKIDNRGIIILGLTSHSLASNKQNDHLLELEQKYQNKNSNDLFSIFTKMEIKDFKKLFKFKSSSSSYHQEYNNDGWVASWKDDYTENAIEKYKTIFKNFEFDYDVIEKLCEFKNDNNGLLFYAFRIPSSSKMEILEDNLSTIDFKEVKNRMIECGYSWLEFKNSSNYESYDASHLDKTSAIQLSKELAQKLLLSSSEI